MKTTSFLWASLLMPLCLMAKADTVYLSNGDEINGTILEDNGTTVVVKTANGAVRSFRKADVDSVVYERRGRPTPTNTSTNTNPNGTKPETGTAKTTTTDSKDPAVAKTSDDNWTAPPNLTGFPDHAKRMDKAKEKVFMYALEKLANSDESVRNEARNDISDLGPGAIPYVVAGLQSENVEVRAACMRLLGQFDARSAVKASLEAFYAAMPDRGAAAEFQVPFIRAAKETMPVLTDERFIEVDPKSAQVQDGLRQYVEWYNTHFDKIPAQLGEPKLDTTDKDYAAKLKDARALKLAKKKFKDPAEKTDDANPETASTGDKSKKDKTKTDKDKEKEKEPTPEEKEYGSIFERKKAGDTEDNTPKRQDQSIFERKPTGGGE